MLEIKEIICKSALVKSHLPDADYVINPYTGCELACSYCYASFMSKFIDKPFSSWGNFIYPKINIVEVLQKQLLSKKLDKTKTILMSSVTDPYTFIEKKYELTKQILQTLSDNLWQGRIGILSKNPLLIRDMDIFKQLQNIEVGKDFKIHGNENTNCQQKKILGVPDRELGCNTQLMEELTNKLGSIRLLSKGITKKCETYYKAAV